MAITIDAIHTNNAPAAIGTYSQAIRAGDLVFLSGQIGLDREGNMVAGGLVEQAAQVFHNLQAVAEAAGGSLARIVKLNISLAKTADLDQLNAVMQQFFAEPYPARATVGVFALPKQALIEIEAVMALA